MGRATNPGGQLDLVAQLFEECTRVEAGLTNIEDSLNPEIDANPNDRLLMEMLDVVSDARESISELRDLLQTMGTKDRSEEMP